MNLTRMPAAKVQMPQFPPRATPYQVLGVARDASATELRRAYRRQMRRTHPDLGGAPEDFAAVQRAWEQVGEARARAAYDRTGGARGASGRAPGSAPSPRVWTSGPTAAQEAGRARSHGHPGGSSRERYLSLLREWVGRGAGLTDPYDETLIARAPAEIRHALADASAEEATAAVLAGLGTGFTIWHDVATETGSQGWAADAGADTSDPAKIDHIVLGPSGLFALQSEDWGAPVQVRGRDLASAGLDRRARPMAALARRAKLSRRWRATFSALVIVLPDEAIEERVTVLRRRGTPRLVVQRSGLDELLRAGYPAGTGMDLDRVFALRSRLQERIRFV